MPLRTFLAVDIAKDTRRRLAEIVRLVDARGLAIKPVKPENMHVTLNFLGDVADGQLSEICSLASEVAAQIEPFEFCLDGVLCVPPRGHVRMIWAPVAGASGRMAELQEKLTVVLEALGFARERRGFSPHVTMARIRRARDHDALRERIDSFAGEQFAPQSAAEIVTYNSSLAGEGPTYTVAGRERLGRGD